MCKHLREAAIGALCWFRAGTRSSTAGKVENALCLRVENKTNDLVILFLIVITLLK
jgi:hypothetical protein